MPHRTTLLLIRHGETEYNKSGIIQGHVDSALTQTGQQQATRLGERLKGIAVDSLWHSDLGRAVETSKLLNLSVTATADPRLREIHCGIADGRNFEQVRDEHPAYYQQWHQEQPNFCFPNGETFLQVQDRMLQVIREAAIKHAGQTVAVVSHGTALRLFLKRIVKIPLGQPTGWYLRNTSVTRIEYLADDDWRLFSFGDVAHLEDF